MYNFNANNLKKEKESNKNILKFPKLTIYINSYTQEAQTQYTQRIPRDVIIRLLKVFQKNQILKEAKKEKKMLP